MSEIRLGMKKKIKMTEKKPEWEQIRELQRHEREVERHRIELERDARERHRKAEWKAIEIISERLKEEM